MGGKSIKTDFKSHKMQVLFFKSLKKKHASLWFNIIKCNNENHNSLAVS